MKNTSLSDELQELAAGYILDNLDEAEMMDLERLMQENSALREELKGLEEVMGILAYDVPVMQPPAHLRDRILQAAKISTSEVSSTETVKTLSHPWRNIITILAILSTLILAIDNLRLRQQFSIAQKQELERVASLLQQPKSRLVALTGEQEGSQSAGTLLFTPGKWEEVVLSLKDLPPLPPGEIYRLWLKLDNNQSIFCGEFNTNKKGSVFIRLNPPELPPKGVKATELFVTINQANSPLDSTDKKIMTGLL
jgi:hypothetical protein